MSRIYLNVPFSEKEQAKEVGARWDGERKSWWIDSTIDKNLFSRWLSRNEQQTGGGPAAGATQALPIFQDLDQAKSDWAIEDIEMMSYIDECAGIEIIFVPRNCWRCHNEIIVFHAGALNPDPSSMLEVTSFMYWPDILYEVDKARREFALPRMGVIKSRFSKTLGRKYVSQGCVHCDALVGEMPMHEDFTTICAEGRIFGNREFKYKMSPNWPPEGFEEVAEQIRAEYEDENE